MSTLSPCTQTGHVLFAVSMCSVTSLLSQRKCGLLRHLLDTSFRLEPVNANGSGVKDGHVCSLKLTTSLNH